MNQRTYCCRRPLRFLLIIVGALLASAGCTGGDSDAESQADNAGSTTVFEAKPTINLVVNDWTASALNVAVAEQLIERELGYPVVPTRLNSATEIYDGLAEGTVDAQLEIWPSTMSDADRLYFDRSEVLDLGPLGPKGKIGWFVPGYVLDEWPEFATWEGLQDRNAASTFATDETGANGRFLGATADYHQFDQEIIDNLNLPLEVVYSGSEDATLSELETSVGAEEPILLYWWTPTAAVGAYDLVEVELPPTSEGCLAAMESGGSNVDCGYPEDELFKAASPALAAKAPEIEFFLGAFSLSNADQISMLVAVEVDGLTVDEAAAAWIAANEAVWQSWLPE